MKIISYMLFMKLILLLKEMNFIEFDYINDVRPLKLIMIMEFFIIK